MNETERTDLWWKMHEYRVRGEWQRPRCNRDWNLVDEGHLRAGDERQSCKVDSDIQCGIRCRVGFQIMRWQSSYLRAYLGQIVVLMIPPLGFDPPSKILLKNAVSQGGCSMRIVLTLAVSRLRKNGKVEVFHLQASRYCWCVFQGVRQEYIAKASTCTAGQVCHIDNHGTRKNILLTQDDQHWKSCWPPEQSE